ncbi:monosaccharide ABC transporter ATP-binding protein (CUT2 family) [Actinocorallia herbida]|uniref:Monosaccharide ABC transporter ATP-binding protein (CUT2 family) n=1 Tax=Actinocorallia herbida TaxID=58109 RepID=A0A3N1CWW4_9ACTN|nr:sugar ABC transporter ATP-binding protein [Actinocorallia herbida]ROO85781.1 monosaccharide ABC transporter ATP-binding protein (CUT2 family) [Actinocorallia herbida]
MSPVVAVSGLTKRYGGTTVLHDVGLELAAGEIVGLVGTNGAGKSTLIKILSGAVAPTGGEIRVAGARVVLRDPLAAKAAGIQTVHQDIDAGIVPGASVAENLTLDGLATGGRFVTGRGTRARARRIAEAAGFDAPLDAPAESLPPGPRQHLVIARALHRRPRLLILDEPTSSLARAEADALLDLVRGLAADGVAVLYVTHRLAEVGALCDRAVVLRDGEIGAVFPAPFDPAVLVSAMLGARFAPAAREAPVVGGPVLEATGIRALPEGTPFDLTVREGEVVGVTGLVGAGKTELLEQLFGARPLLSGVLTLDGRGHLPRDPAAAVDAGVALVAEEREAQAVVPGWSVRAHVGLPRRAARFGVLSGAAEARAAVRTIAAFGVTPADPAADFATLSGGNQQKALVGRWFDGASRLLLLDEPFRGVDVGARAEIARRVRAGAATVGVLVASADPHEVLQLADRIVVLRDGGVAGELPAAEAAPERLAALLAGAAEGEKE